jgi:hypothetical protein
VKLLNNQIDIRMVKWFVIILIGIIISSCSGPKKLFDTETEYLEPVPFLYQLGAYSSIRNHEAELTFYDVEHAEYQEHGIITILDEKHRDKGKLVLDYGRFRNLETMKLQVRNDKGDIVGAYTIKDAEDYSASGSSFYTDVRYKVLEGYHYSYPYTIEYEYKYNYTGTLNLPGWSPKSYDQSLINATFTIVDYSKGNVRYHSRNLESKPDTTETPEFIQTQWKLTAQIAREYEPYSPPYPEIFPNVITAASEFKVDKSEGNAASWNSFGKWYYELTKGKRELPQEAKDEVDEILSESSNEKETVERLYQYMQDQMRYVSIQLGLGGWEPYDAEYVYHNKYGDCKALVNFMQALLDYAGIEAKPALIGRGLHRPKVIPDFPSNQFNHVVLRVELKDGSEMWLECTSKYMKPGRIGPDNEGRYALIVSEEGGELVKTELSAAKQNSLYRVTRVKLEEKGTADITSSLKNAGAMDDNLLRNLRPLSKKKREEWLEKTIDLNDFSLLNYEFIGLEGENLQTGYEIELKANNFASASSKRLFVPVNQLNQWSVYIPSEESRSTSLQLPYRYSEADSTIFELPEGYRIESLPNSQNIENNFGRFTLDLVPVGQKVVIKRDLQIFKREVSEDEYQDFKDFFSTINKADQSQFVIVRE